MLLDLGGSRQDINEFYEGALGTQPHGVFTKIVTRAFAETLGPLYHRVRSIGRLFGDDGTPRNEIARVNGNTRELKKFEDQMPRRRRNARRKRNGAGARKGRRRRPQPVRGRGRRRGRGGKAAIVMRRRAGGPAPRNNRVGPPITQVQRRSAAPVLFVGPAGKNTIVVEGKALIGTIVINASVWDAKKEWNQNYSTSATLATVSAAQSVTIDCVRFGAMGPDPGWGVAGQGVQQTWPVGDLIFPLHPLMQRTTPAVISAQVTTRRRYKFIRCTMEAATKMPTVSTVSCAMAYTPDITVLDLGHSGLPQGTWNDNVIKNMAPNVVWPAWQSATLDVTKYLDKKWFYMRNQHSAPNTPTSWNVVNGDTKLDISTYYQTSVPTASAFATPTEGPFAMRDSLQYSGSWDTADVRQSIQGGFIFQIDRGQDNFDGKTVNIADLYMHYTLLVTDYNHTVGSNTGQQYQYIGAPSNGLTTPSTALALSTSSAKSLSSDEFDLFKRFQAWREREEKTEEVDVEEEKKAVSETERS